MTLRRGDSSEARPLASMEAAMLSPRRSVTFRASTLRSLLRVALHSTRRDRAGGTLRERQGFCGYSPSRYSCSLQQPWPLMQSRADRYNNKPGTWRRMAASALTGTATRALR
jgi:hypothetical protein